MAAMGPARQQPTAERKNGSPPRFLASGDAALIVEFGSTVDRRTNAKVLTLFDRLTAAKIPGVIEAIPTFRSLLVQYDPLTIRHRELRARLEGMVKGLVGKKHAGRRWHIPLCYGGAHGPDLEDVAKRTGMTPKQVIETHSAVDYNVYMIGFLPGYPYMGDLPQMLELPRRENPRLKVAPGSVCIAMRMTAIYPIESPGGWNLLGRTPARLWDMRADPPALLATGDMVRFEPISAEEFERLDRRALAGTWRMEAVAA